MINLDHEFGRAVNPLDSFVMSMQDAGAKCAELASASFNPALDNTLAAVQTFDHS